MMLERRHAHHYHKKARSIKIIVRYEHEERIAMENTPQQLAQQLITDAQTLEAALSTASQPTTADNVLSAVVEAVKSAGLVVVYGEQPLVDALNAAGYSITPPANASTSTDTAPAA